VAGLRLLRPCRAGVSDSSVGTLFRRRDVLAEARGTKTGARSDVAGWVVGFAAMLAGLHLWAAEATEPPAFGGELKFAKTAFHSGEEIPFQFVLTNQAKREWGLWSRSCSWGHEGYTFEIALPDGRTVQATEPLRTWHANARQVTKVAPGGTFVAEFSLRGLVVFTREKPDAPPRRVPLAELLSAGKIKIIGLYTSKSDLQLAKYPRIQAAVKGLWEGSLRTTAVEITLTEAKMQKK